MRRLVLAFVASSSAACAMGPHIPQPNSLDQGMLIVRVQARGALIRRFSKLADTAEIVALDSFGTPVPGLRARSGMAVNGYMVFFGLPAGRYVLREASFPARGVRYRLLPNQVGEFKRSIVLRRGTVAYLGDYSFDSIWPELGVATERIVRIVAHWLTPFLKRPVIPRDANMDPYEPGPQEETRALHAVREALSESQWARLVDARLRELSASEPAKVEGALRSRAIALNEEPFLSWRDTLKWGEPRRVPDAIAWRRPGGEAQIAVFFTTASAPGFGGWAAAVSELRRSASASVEDSGAVYEVKIATRIGLAARTTKYEYTKGTLVGSETKVLVTETTLVPDGYGLFTARLRAPRDEFDVALPAYREFLLQLILGPPKPKAPPKQDVDLPFQGGVQ